MNENSVKEHPTKEQKAKRDLMTAIRVYKNRIDIYGDLIIMDLKEFDPVFAKCITRYHCGEINALKDMLITYLAMAYRMGVRAGKLPTNGLLGNLEDIENVEDN